MHHPVTCDQQLPTLHEASAVESFRRQYCVDPDRIRRVLHGIYQLHEPLGTALARLPEQLSAAMRKQFELSPLRIARRVDSEQDGSTKLLLRAVDGETVEAVLMRAATGRMSVCVSSQVGCRAGCPFCATAAMGLRRQLAAPEIVEQVTIAARLARAKGRRLRNVVFMGMGEPLDNELALHQALDRLLDQRHGMALPPRRVLVSTVGVPDAMKRLIDRFPGVHVALSLHSARPELRGRLVPWSRKHDWGEVRRALQYVADRHATYRHQGPVMIQYLMVAGVNDQPHDAEALMKYLAGIRAHVNLIPYNQISSGPAWRPTPRPMREAFANRLREAGLFTTIRYSMGADIQAACGQLVVPSETHASATLATG
jgi:23S rRNA (adenine2503-C2)-methyltransferase